MNVRPFQPKTRRLLPGLPALFTMLLLMALCLGPALWLGPAPVMAQMPSQGLPAGHPPAGGAPALAPSGKIREGRIAGRIAGAAEGVTLSGIKVVLVEFRLNEEGKPQGRPVQERMTDAEGRYVFDKVVVEQYMAFQLGANIGGQMVGSQPFTFPGEQTEITLDLSVPKVVKDTTGLKFREGVLVLEPRRGVLWVTEVLHMDNGTGNTIEGEKRPLTLSIPEDAKELEWLSRPRDQGRNERLGDHLLIHGNIPPGRTTVAFRYRMDVPLGSLTLTKRYPHAMDLLSVLSPKGSLTLEAEAFSRRPTQQIEGVSYDAWALEAVAPDLRVPLTVTGLPMQQEWLLFALAFFFIPMGGVAVWFLWVRLPSSKTTAAG